MFESWTRVVIDFYIYLPALCGMDKQGYFGQYKALVACVKRQLAKMGYQLIIDICICDYGARLILSVLQ